MQILFYINCMYVMVGIDNLMRIIRYHPIIILFTNNFTKKDTSTKEKIKNITISLICSGNNTAKVVRIGFWIIVSGMCLISPGIVYGSHAPTISIDQHPAVIEHSIIITVTDESQTVGTINISSPLMSIQPTLTEISPGLFVYKYVRITATPGNSDYLLARVGDTIIATYTAADGATVSTTTTVTTSIPTQQQYNMRFPNTQKPSPGYGEPVNPNLCYDFGTDEDGICDNWEHESSQQDPGLVISWPTGSTYRYPCDPECPSPNINDIYVEIDYMEGHYPDLEALKLVKDAFRNKGIALHMQIDEMALYHNTNTKFPGYNTNFPNNAGFDQIKAKFNGTSNERSDSNWNTINWKSKKQAFHYALFVHGYGTSSGIGEVFGNDFMISLGSFAGGVGSTDEQAATFMHELGHNLSLHHGGASDATNCKPNYVSIMNYAYQFPNFVSDRKLSYSEGKLGPSLTTPTLFENGLDEEKGLIANPIPQRIVYGLIPPINLPSTGGSIDWDQVGGIKPSASGTTSADINNLPGCGSTVSATTLAGKDDWNSLKLKITESGGYFASGIGAAPINAAEISQLVNYANTSEIRMISGAIELPNDGLTWPDTELSKSGEQEITKEIAVDQRVLRITSLECFLNLDVSECNDQYGNGFADDDLYVDDDNKFETVKKEILGKTTDIKKSLKLDAQYDAGGLTKAIKQIESLQKHLKGVMKVNAYQFTLQSTDDIIKAYRTSEDFTPTDIHPANTNTGNENTSGENTNGNPNGQDGGGEYDNGILSAIAVAIAASLGMIFAVRERARTGLEQ